MGGFLYCLGETDYNFCGELEGCVPYNPRYCDSVVFLVSTKAWFQNVSPSIASTIVLCGTYLDGELGLEKLYGTYCAQCASYRSIDTVVGIKMILVSHFAGCLIGMFFIIARPPALQ